MGASACAQPAAASRGAAAACSLQLTARLSGSSAGGGASLPALPQAHSPWLARRWCWAGGGGRRAPLRAANDPSRAPAALPAPAPLQGPHLGAHAHAAAGADALGALGLGGRHKGRARAGEHRGLHPCCLLPASSHRSGPRTAGSGTSCDPECMLRSPLGRTAACRLVCSSHRVHGGRSRSLGRAAVPVGCLPQCVSLTCLVAGFCAAQTAPAFTQRHKPCRCKRGSPPRGWAAGAAVAAGRSHSLQPARFAARFWAGCLLAVVIVCRACNGADPHEPRCARSTCRAELRRPPARRCMGAARCTCASPPPEIGLRFT